MEKSKLLGWASSRPGDSGALKGALESVLFVSGEAISVQKIADILDCETDVARGLLTELQEDYSRDERGIQLREVAGGYRMFSHPAYSRYVERLVVGWDARRLTAAALETLAIVAYRQPVGRALVSAIRGVNSDAVLASLVQKELIAEVGREKAPGNPVLYGTTRAFLEKFGLRNLRDLPPIEEFTRATASDDAPATGSSADQISFRMEKSVVDGTHGAPAEGDGQSGGSFS